MLASHKGLRRTIYMLAAIMATLAPKLGLAGSACESLPQSSVPLLQVDSDVGALGQHHVYPYQGKYRLQYVGFMDAPERLSSLNAFDLVFEPDGKLNGIAPVNLTRLKGADRRKMVAARIQTELSDLEKKIPDLEFDVEQAKALPASKRKSALKNAKNALKHALDLQGRLEEQSVDFEAGRIIEFHLWADAQSSKRKGRANPFDVDGRQRELSVAQHDALVTLANMDIHLDRSPSSSAANEAMPSPREIGARIFSNRALKSLPKGLSNAQAAVLLDLVERYRKQFGCKDFKPAPQPMPMQAKPSPATGGSYTAGANILDFTQ